MLDHASRSMKIDQRSLTIELAFDLSGVMSFDANVCRIYAQARSLVSIIPLHLTSWNVNFIQYHLRQGI